jgi:menaquinol-cytochrome c reductase iron-sulfur subunit
MREEQPSGSDQNEAGRRSFLKTIVGFMGVMGSLILCVPLIGSLVGPMLQKQSRQYAKVGNIDSMPTGQPQDVTFPEQVTDAYIHRTAYRDVWIIKHSATDLTVFSPICTHLGCRFNWNPDSRHFECPCHGSVYAIDGKVLAGPAPRPLDTLPFRLDKGELYVIWERFRVGISQKILA